MTQDSGATRYAKSTETAYKHIGMHVVGLLAVLAIKHSPVFDLEFYFEGLKNWSKSELAEIVVIFRISSFEHGLE